MKLRTSCIRWAAAAASLIVAFLLLLGPATPEAPAVSDPGFSDVPTSSTFHEAITTLAKEGIVSGYTDGTFRPRGPVLRAQFAKMVCGTLELPVHEGLVPSFTDLRGDDPAGLYPHDYVAAAAAANIIYGYGDNTFRPYRDISRAQVISMVVRGIRSLHPQLLDNPPASFKPSWNPASLTPHGENTTIAEYNGLLTRLNPKSLDPWAVMPRQEVAQVLANVLAELSAQAPAPTPPPTMQPGADVLHFWWTPDDDWRVFNVTDHTGMRAGNGRPLAWVDDNENNHIAAITQLVENGPYHLVHFWAPALSPNNWQVEDVTAMLGSQALEVSRVLSHWRDVSEGRDHILARQLPSGLVHYMREANGTWRQHRVSGYSPLSAVGWWEPPPQSINRTVMYTEGDQLLHLWGGDTGPWGHRLIATAPDIRASNGLVRWPGKPFSSIGGGGFEPVVGAVGRDRHLHTVTGESFDSWIIADVADSFQTAERLELDFDLTLMTGRVPYVVAGFERLDGKVGPMVYDMGANGTTRTSVFASFAPQDQPDLLWGFDSYLTRGPTPSDPWDQHIVAVDKQRRLLVFWKNEDESIWRLVDVSAITSTSVSPYTDSWATGTAWTSPAHHIVAIAR